MSVLYSLVTLRCGTNDFENSTINKVFSAPKHINRETISEFSELANEIEDLHTKHGKNTKIWVEIENFVLADGEPEDREATNSELDLLTGLTDEKFTDMIYSNKLRYRDWYTLLFVNDSAEIVKSFRYDENSV
jgi:hypothetical protein